MYDEESIDVRAVKRQRLGVVTVNSLANRTEKGDLALGARLGRRARLGGHLEERLLDASDANRVAAW